jgi:hypothetical protein
MRARMQNWRPQRSLSTRPLRQPQGTAYRQSVNFYGKEDLSLPRIQASTERYHREWPMRKWEPEESLRFYIWLILSSTKFLHHLLGGSPTAYATLREVQRFTCGFRRTLKANFHIVHHAIVIKHCCDTRSKKSAKTAKTLLSVIGLQNGRHSVMNAPSTILLLASIVRSPESRQGNRSHSLETPSSLRLSVCHKIRVSILVQN